MSLTIRPIFICKANVGRSQIAEGIFNSLYGVGSSLSIAGLEARKEKYHGSPDAGIIQSLKQYKNIDISLQKIKYLSDFSYEQGMSLNLVVFLFDPTILMRDKEYINVLENTIAIHNFLQENKKTSKRPVEMTDLSYGGLVSSGSPTVTTTTVTVTMSGGVDDDGHWITLSNTTITLMLAEWAVAMCFATSLLVFSGFPAHITASHDGSFY